MPSLKKPVLRSMLVVALCCAFLALSGCSIKGIAKNELDLAAEISVKTVQDFLIEMTLEMYHLNPNELKKTPNVNLQIRSAQIIDHPVSVTYKEIHGKQSVDAINLAFSPQYTGDRVFALMIGISGMLSDAYDNQREFYILDQLHPQKIYNSSVNLDLIRQKLQNQKSSKPYFIVLNKKRPFYIYNLLSKMAAVQEMMANLTSDKTGRIVNKTLRGAVPMLLPIGI